MGSQGVNCPFAAAASGVKGTESSSKMSKSLGPSGFHRLGSLVAHNLRDAGVRFCRAAGVNPDGVSGHMCVPFLVCLTWKIFCAHGRHFARLGSAFLPLGGSESRRSLRPRVLAFLGLLDLGRPFAQHQKPHSTAHNFAQSAKQHLFRSLSHLAATFLRSKGTFRRPHAPLYSWCYSTAGCDELIADSERSDLDTVAPTSRSLVTSLLSSRSFCLCGGSSPHWFVPAACLMVSLALIPYEDVN